MSDFVLEGIVDSTLREGEQRAGVIFDRHGKLAMVDQLVTLGIEEIEVGVSSPRSPELLSIVPEARKTAKGRSVISLWCRCHEEDISFARQCNPDALSLSIPISDILIREKLARDRQWVTEQLERSISKALQLGFGKVSVGLEDATRAAPEFLFDIARLVDVSGASRLRLADTVGIASPGHISDMVKSIKRKVSIPVGVHTHNDFGMATANAIAAVEAGARWVDATVLGLGERTGNCRLEEIVGYLALQKDIYRYKVQNLTKVCNLVAQAANTPILNHHPVIGKDIFTCESGLHVQALAINPRTYEPFDPLRLGHSRKLLFGSKTGRRAVQKSLKSAGMSTSQEQIDDLVNEIRRLVETGSEPLVENELIRLARQRIITV